MGSVELALVGIGSLRYGCPILASLPHLQPGPNWTIRLFDTDLERLDLMDRLARKLLIEDDVFPRILSTDEPEDAIAESNLIIVAIGGNTARRYWEPLPRLDRSSDSGLPSATPIALEVWFESHGSETPAVVSARPGDPVDRRQRIKRLWRTCDQAVTEPARVLNLTEELSPELGPPSAWPGSLSAAERRARPHQILRWIRGEEHMGTYVSQFAASPVVRWLRDQVEPLT